MKTIAILILTISMCIWVHIIVVVKLIARCTHLTPVTQSDSNDAKELLVGTTSREKGDIISILMNMMR